MVGENNKNINPVAELNIPLSLFSYKDYNSDFIISWYNVASKIYKQINYSSAEKQRLNLALSVLMFPYIALTALGVVSHRQAIKKNHKDPTLNEKKTNQAKKLVYNILTLAVVCINVVILTALLIPATVALAIFYALNKELSKDLITVLKISKENRYEDQNITVSIHDEEIETSNIEFNIKIEFPKQFHRLIRDLTKDNNRVEIISNKKGNITLKLSAGITLKDGLTPLRGEIKKLLETSLKEFTATIGKLIALEKKDITYDKLKELLNEFRLKVVDNIDSKIISYLIEDAYKVAFIQAIKIGKERRKEEFISEDRLKEVLIKQELKNQGEKLPTEKEFIVKELNKLKGEKINANDVDDKIYQILKLEYKVLLHKSEYEALPGEEGLIEKTNIDIYRESCPQKIDSAVSKAEEKIKELKQKGERRYTKIENELKKICEALKIEEIPDDDLRQKLKDLFKPNTDQNTLHKNFRRSQLDKAVNLLKHIPWDEVSVLVEYINNEKNARNLDSINKGNGENLNLINNHRELHKLIVDYDKEVTDREIGYLINKITKTIAEYKLNCLHKQQKEDGLELLSEGDIEFFNLKKIIKAELLKNASLELLKEKIERQYENLKNEHDSIKTNYDLVKKQMIKIHLKNSDKFLELLKQLKLEQEELTINEETENAYKARLSSNEKIKFLIIENKLIELLKKENFDKIKTEIKTLLEAVELEYCLADKCIKNPTVAIKDNVKHFCQDLLSPLIDELTTNFINNLQKDKDDGWINFGKKKLNVAKNLMQLGAGNNKYKNINNTIDLANKTIEEADEIIRYFETNCEEIGELIGNTFSDEGETFKNVVWPRIKDNLYEISNRFLQDIEIKVIPPTGKNNDMCEISSKLLQSTKMAIQSGKTR